MGLGDYKHLFPLTQVQTMVEQVSLGQPEAGGGLTLPFPALDKREEAQGQ